LTEVLGQRYAATGCDITEFDITDRLAVESFVGEISPAVVIHTAAFTDVDACESEKERAMAVNAAGTRNVAEACRAVGARMVYFSTDYVFDGKKEAPYIEEDPPQPLTVYGRSKLEGERHVQEIVEDHVILRLAWVYGYYGRNFARTMIKLGYEQTRAVQRGEIISPLKVVNDQTGNPTWTREIARQTAAVLKGNHGGLFHCTADGYDSWYGFAQQIFETLGMTVLLRPCATTEFPRPAPRPAYSALENRRLKQAGIDSMRPWREALNDFLLSKKETLLSCDAP
jgi:dTDP-4-dehydrorhamnose reductase